MSHDYHERFLDAILKALPLAEPISRGLTADDIIANLKAGYRIEVAQLCTKKAEYEAVVQRAKEEQDALVEKEGTTWRKLDQVLALLGGEDDGPVRQQQHAQLQNEVKEMRREFAEKHEKIKNMLSGLISILQGTSDRPIKDMMEQTRKTSTTCASLSTDISALRQSTSHILAFLGQPDGLANVVADAAAPIRQVLATSLDRISSEVTQISDDRTCHQRQTARHAGRACPGCPQDGAPRPASHGSGARSGRVVCSSSPGRCWPYP